MFLPEKPVEIDEALSCSKDIWPMIRELEGKNIDTVTNSFQMEASILSALRHDNIVRLYDS
jgi:serine/threonine protein kinase